jgi:uncharacterized membrane protein
MDYAEYKKGRDNFFKLILILLVILLLMKACANYNYEKTFDKTFFNLAEDSGALPKPIQKGYRSKGKIQVGNTEVNMLKKAKYKIIGRVVSTEEHSTDGIDDLLSPRDLALSWGLMSLDRNHKKVEYDSNGREYTYRIADNSLLDEYGSLRAVFTSTSNNHIIPANDELKKILNEIKVGNVVLIEGYLVNLEWNENDGKHYWKSSTRRDDTRDHSCELIYTTSIKVVQ